MNIDNTWIKTFRSLISWEWFTKPETLQLFIYCLLRANYEDTSWQGISIKKGSFVTSFDTLSIETKQTIQQLRTNLSRLKRTKEISTKSTNKYTIITICKYEDYQYAQQTNNKQTTNKQQTNNKQTTTDKNIKKNKNKEEYNNIHTKKSENFFENFEEVEAEEIPTLETQEEIPLQKSSAKKVSPIKDVFLNNLSKFQNDYPNTKRFEELCMVYKKSLESMRKLFDEFIEDNRKSREHATKENYTYFYQSIDKHFFYWAKAKISKPTTQTKREQQSEIYKAINEGKSITEILGV
jgi:hypothetical protein